MIAAHITEVFRWHDGQLDVSKGWAGLVVVLFIFTVLMFRRSW